MSLEYCNTLKLDWLTFVYTPDLDHCRADGTVIGEFFHVFPELKVDYLVSYQRSRLRYDNAYFLTEGLEILYNESIKDDGKAVAVTCSAQGLEQLHKLFSAKTVKQLLTDLYDRGAEISRIDLAFDDYSKTYMPIDYFNWYQEGRISSRLHTIGFLQSGPKKSRGTTFYLGRRGENKYLRIYDKEVESKGKMPCVRYEFELHKQGSRKLVKDLVEYDLEYSFSSLLLSCLRILKDGYSEGTQKCKQQTDPDWYHFLETQVSRIDETKFKVSKSDSSYDRSIYHFEHQYTKSIAMFVAVEGTEWLNQVLQNGLDEWYRDDISKAKFRERVKQALAVAYNDH